MLYIELPWDQAAEDCPEYLAWKTNDYEHLTPWKKLDRQSLAYIQKILVPTPNGRYKLSDIKKYFWYNIGYETGICIFYGVFIFLSLRNFSCSFFIYSQIKMTERNALTTNTIGSESTRFVSRNQNYRQLESTL